MKRDFKTGIHGAVLLPVLCRLPMAPMDLGQSQLTGMAGSLVVWRWRPEFAVLYQMADLTFIEQISSCEIVVLNC